MSGLAVFLANLLRGLWARPPVLVVLALNLLPVLGVMWWGWSALALLLLYWAENVVVGVVNVLKMAVVAVRGGPLGVIEGLFTIPFFVIHYGLFCLGHLVFATLLGGGLTQNQDPFVAALGVWEQRAQYGWSFAGLAAIHLAGFVGWLRAGDWRDTQLRSQMAEPYGRIIVMHLTVLLGAALVAWLGWPPAGVALLGVLKTIYEVAAANRRMDRAEKARTAAPGVT